eukprot:9714177-Prorocentrum_lima.AAC.1
MRATLLGDVLFIFRVVLNARGRRYVVLVAVEAATIKTLLRCKDEVLVTPKAICGDMYFTEPKFHPSYLFHG